MNNKYLLGIFVALLGMYFVSKMFSTKTERSFKTELIAIDTSVVTKVVLHTKADKQEKVTLEKSGQEWTVTKGSKTTKAEAGAIGSLLNQMVLVKTKRIAAKNEAKWGDYEVDETNGNRVQIYAGNELLNDFVVGRFSFNQAARTATTFLRLSEAPDVYAVDGFLSMSFGQGYNAYRPKTVINIRPEDITSIAWQKNGQTTTLAKNGNLWSTATGDPLDSTKVADYLKGISNSNGSKFVDDFDAKSVAADQIQIMTINGNNLLQPIVVTAYQTNSETEESYVIQSNQNPDAYFSSKAEEIFATLFKSVDALK